MLFFVSKLSTSTIVCDWTAIYSALATTHSSPSKNLLIPPHSPKGEGKGGKPLGKSQVNSKATPIPSPATAASSTT